MMSFPQDDAPAAWYSAGAKRQAEFRLRFAPGERSDRHKKKPEAPGRTDFDGPTKVVHRAPYDTLYRGNPVATAQVQGVVRGIEQRPWGSMHRPSSTTAEHRSKMVSVNGGATSDSSRFIVARLARSQRRRRSQPRRRRWLRAKPIYQTAQLNSGNAPRTMDSSCGFCSTSCTTPTRPARHSGPRTERRATLRIGNKILASLGCWCTRRTICATTRGLVRLPR